MLAADELTDDEIAARCDVGRATLARWKTAPTFAARVGKLAKEMGESARRYAIGRTTRRIQGYDDRRRRLLDVIEGRASDPSVRAVPGGPTGLLVRTVKSIGAGEDAQVVEEFAVDTGLLKELRELEKQAAIEAGQWVQKVAPTTPDGQDEHHPFSAADTRAVVAALLARLGCGDDGPTGEGHDHAP